MDPGQPVPSITAEELSAILAHEIKNPMNSIIINAEVLKSCFQELSKEADAALIERTNKYLGVIQTEVNRLDKVIKGFLDFAHPSPSSRFKFKVSPFLQELKQLTQMDFKAKGAELILDLEEPSPSMIGNPDQIKQAVLNLAINGLQSLSWGGRVQISSYTKESRVVIEIEDNGVGIPESIRGKIYAPFFTTKEKGSGVGLFIVQRVIREHSGKIDLESTEGKGSRFVVSFPLAETGSPK